MAARAVECGNLASSSAVGLDALPAAGSDSVVSRFAAVRIAKTSLHGVATTALSGRDLADASAISGFPATSLNKILFLSREASLHEEVLKKVSSVNSRMEIINIVKVIHRVGEEHVVETADSLEIFILEVHEAVVVVGKFLIRKFLVEVRSVADHGCDIGLFEPGGGPCGGIRSKHSLEVLLSLRVLKPDWGPCSWVATQHVSVCTETGVRNSEKGNQSHNSLHA